MDRAAAARFVSRPCVPEPRRITQIWTGFAERRPRYAGRVFTFGEGSPVRTSARTPWLVAVACLSATVLLVVGLSATHSPVGAATTEFVTNPSVETTLAPWSSAYNPSSRVQRTTGGYDGTYAVRATNNQTASRDVGFRDSPSQVSSTVAGQAYNLSVWVRSEVAGQDDQPQGQGGHLERQLPRCAHAAVSGAGHGVAPHRLDVRRPGDRERPLLRGLRDGSGSQPGLLGGPVLGVGDHPRPLADRSARLRPRPRPPAPLNRPSPPPRPTPPHRPSPPR